MYKPREYSYGFTMVAADTHRFAIGVAKTAKSTRIYSSVVHRLIAFWHLREEKHWNCGCRASVRRNPLLNNHFPCFNFSSSVVLPPFTFDSYISKIQMFKNDWRTNKKVYVAFIRLISTLGALGHCAIWKYIKQNWMEGVVLFTPVHYLSVLVYWFILVHHMRWDTDTSGAQNWKIGIQACHGFPSKLFSDDIFVTSWVCINVLSCITK